MFTNTQRPSQPEVQELRREGGRHLKSLREARGLSQRELCELVGAGLYTFISQIETGRGRIPPDKLRLWAEALGVPPSDFGRLILRFYDPETFALLFGDEEPGDVPLQSGRAGLRLVPCG